MTLRWRDGPEEAPPAPLEREAEELLSWLVVEKGRRPNTVAAYRRDLDAYRRYLADHAPEQTVSEDGVSEDLVADYLAFLRSAGRAPASVARALVAVRALHRFMVDEGMAASDPAAEVRRPKVPSGLPKALSEAQVESLLAAVTGNDALARRDRAILEVLYGCGMRASEVVGLSLADLDVDQRLVRAMGKGGKERIVPVGRPAARALAEWLSSEGRGALVPARWARRGDSEAMFLNARGGRLSRQGVWTVVRDHGRRCGLDGVLSPHVLRHSCATHMLDHGADIRVVQELLGHASLSTTQVYTRVSAARLRAAYEAAHPRARARAAAPATGGSSQPGGLPGTIVT